MLFLGSHCRSHTDHLTSSQKTPRTFNPWEYREPDVQPWWPESTELHKNGAEQGDLFWRLAISDAAGKSRNKDSKFAGIHDITS